MADVVGGPPGAVDEGVDEAAPVRWCSAIIIFVVVVRHRGGERDETRGNSNFAWVGGELGI